MSGKRQRQLRVPIGVVKDRRSDENTPSDVLGGVSEEREVSISSSV